jgi:hypothetical protein
VVRRTRRQVRIIEILGFYGADHRNLWSRRRKY